MKILKLELHFYTSPDRSYGPGQCHTRFRGETWLLKNYHLLSAFFWIYRHCFYTNWQCKDEINMLRNIFFCKKEIFKMKVVHGQNFFLMDEMNNDDIWIHSFRHCILVIIRAGYKKKRNKKMVIFSKNRWNFFIIADWNEVGIIFCAFWEQKLGQLNMKTLSVNFLKNLD